MTDDLISRTALLAAYDKAHVGPPGGARKLIEEAPAANETQVILEALRIVRGICQKDEACVDCPIDSICGFFAGCPCKYTFNINLFAEAQYKLEQEAAKKKEEAATNGEPSFKEWNK